MVNFDQILDNLFVGSCPKTIEDIESLIQAGISAVLNLQTDADFVVQEIDWNVVLDGYRANSIHIDRLQIVDFDEEDFIQLLPEATGRVSELIENGHTVYVHCTAGSERSPGVVTSYLAWYQDMSMAQALAFVQARRKCTPYVVTLNKADKRYRNRPERTPE
ncbi:MAG: hypothetical protein GKR95_23435 [Gammaproteobacteria bacterium]|nr:hypothetical protein [Gammaproteobacteria bacterium]